MIGLFVHIIFVTVLALSMASCQRKTYNSYFSSTDDTIIISTGTPHCHPHKHPKKGK